MRSRIFKVAIVASLVLIGGSRLRADDRVIPPSVTKVWPVGLQRGTTATLTLEGRSLSPTRSVIFDSLGITAKVERISDLEEVKPTERSGPKDLGAPLPLGKKQTLTVEVTVGPDVAPGLHWFRVYTPLGTSNPMPFDVGLLPEVASHDAEDRAEMAPQSVQLPATLVGTITVPGQVDKYRFEGRAGEELVFRVTAAPLGSHLESLLILRDDSGNVLAESGYYDNRADAVLTYKLGESGHYNLAVADREKGGGADYYYRVDAGPLTYLAGVFPLGVRAGEPQTISMKGVNLPNSQDVRVDPPRVADGWTTMPLELKTGGKSALNTVKLAVGGDPEVLEHEPNDSPGEAQMVSAPVTINGHIFSGDAKAGTADEDYFRFHARKNQALTIEVAAARLGSPLDSVIEVLDAKGEPIPRATVRCLKQTDVDYSGSDSLIPNILLTSTSGFHERDYLMIGDELDQLMLIPDQPDADEVMRSAFGQRWTLLGTSPGAHPPKTPVYRVEILPPRAQFPPNGLPVFYLNWRNDDGGPGYGADSELDFVAPEDGDYLVRLRDVRGVEGPDFAYRLSIHDAEPDFQLRATPENPNIPQGGSSFLTVTANRVRGYQGPIELSIEGLPAGAKASEATIPAGQDSTVVLLSADSTAPAGALPTAFRIVGRAKIGGQIRTRIANQDAPLDLASVIPPPDAVVTIGPSHVTLQPGRDATVTLHVDRRHGFEGRVPCTVQNLPPGVRVVNIGLNGVLVTESQSSRTFTLHAEDWAKPITQPVYVVGEVESNSPTYHPSAPLQLEIVGGQ